MGRLSSQSPCDEQTTFRSNSWMFSKTQAQQQQQRNPNKVMDSVKIWSAPKIKSEVKLRTRKDKLLHVKARVG